MSSRYLSQFSGMTGMVRQITMANCGSIFSIEMADSENRDLVLLHNTKSGAFIRPWQNIFHLTCMGSDFKLEMPPPLASASAGAKKKPRK